MYPLLDSHTMTARAKEDRRAGAAARLAATARATGEGAQLRGHGVRRALGMTLVRAGLRLIET
jgi:hypothetical protein